MNVSLHISDTLGQNIAYKTTELPLEKGAGGIFPNDPGIRHANSTQWRRRVSKLYAWADGIGLASLAGGHDRFLSAT